MTSLTDDVDLKTFVELFDTAMTSTNPSVKKCFHNLLMLAALVHAEETNDHQKGPLGKLLDDVVKLQDKVEAIRISTLYQHPSYNDSMYVSTTSTSSYGLPLGTVTVIK
jgi:hypothetical protein